MVEGLVRPAAEEESAKLAALTLREREVLQLLAESKTTKEIAELLNISPYTVDTHRRKIIEKLRMRDVAALTKFAIREGLTTLDQ